MMFVKEQSQGAYEMYCEIENMTDDLTLLPSVIQNLVEALGLDQKEHTKDECIAIGLAAGRIYETLALVQKSLYRMEQDRLNLWKEYEKLKPGTTETTK